MMRLHPTVEIPQWPPSDDPTANSPYCIHEALTALQRYLPSNEPDNPDIEISGQPDSPDTAIDAYSCDHFRMYEFKVRRCVRGRSHDWTECPYAHPGEKARRRDPRKYNYSGAACPDFRKGCCKKGEGCEFAHGVFECWLHPSRYRTQPCKDGANCRRRVCFFAHSADQLRVLNNSPESNSLSSPLKAKTLSFTFTSPSPPESPPESPMKLSRSLGSSSMGEVLASLRSLQLGGKEKWGIQMGGSPVYGSPRGGAVGSMMRHGFRSLPSTPTQCVNNYGRRGGVFDSVCEEEEEPVMERVESGRDLRMKMFERISKGSNLERVDLDPDVEWVSDLVN